MAQEPKRRKGLLHLYAGDGKGKTTAAVGMAVRAAGQGLRVFFMQFLKGRDTGELEGLRRLGIEWIRAGDSEKFLFQMTTEEKAVYLAGQRRSFLEAAGRAGAYDLLILDEGLDAMRAGVFSEQELLEWIDGRPPGLELVLTGREPTQALVDRADYYSRIEKEKHPWDQGLQARRGIEY